MLLYFTGDTKKAMKKIKMKDILTCVNGKRKTIQRKNVNMFGCALLMAQEKSRRNCCKSKCARMGTLHDGAKAKQKQQNVSYGKYE